MPFSDIAVIGGGPAGMAVALEFAQAGFLVTVIEPRGPNIDKPCGEGIMPYGVEHLKRLGVYKYLDPNHMAQFAGITFINENGREAYSDFAEGVGLACRRTNLSEALYKCSYEFPNISFIKNKVLAIKKNRKAMTVITENNQVQCHLVVGADGLRSFTRRYIGLKKSTSRKRYGLRKHFFIRPWSNRVEVYFHKGIEAYVTPLKNEMNIAFLWTKGKVLVPEVTFANFLALFPQLQEKLHGKASASQELAIGPLEQVCLSPITDGVALVGDASGYLDAITGEGISLAFLEARALFLTTYQSLRVLKNVLSLSDLYGYKEMHHNIVRSYYRTTRMMLWLSSHPYMMRSIIDLGSRYPRFFSSLINRARNKGITSLNLLDQINQEA